MSSWEYEQYGRYYRTVPPTVFPVTVDQAKFSVGIASDDDSLDSELESLLRVAVDMVERDSRRCLMPQTWQMVLDRFPSDVILLPSAPLLSLTHIKYVINGVLTTFSSTLYQTDLVSEPGRVCPISGQCWPNTDCDTLNAVQFQWQAGYASPSVLDQERPSARGAVIAAFRHLFRGDCLSANYWSMIYRMRP